MIIEMKKKRTILVLTFCLLFGMSFGQELSRESSERIKADLALSWKAEQKAKYEKALVNRVMVRDSLKMFFWWKTYGECPSDGRSLYISMHGGGNAPSTINDQQWLNQTQLYHPSEGVYVAPRAPWNDWDMWFKPGMDEFLDDLIHTAVSCWDVNPDKVYLLGYSAGGDGVWRMGPRMADRWAAASMMAGHPGDVSLLSLRNTPFMIWCGELDSAYDRNKMARIRGQEMDSLSVADPGSYIHSTHIVEGKPHWMDQVDTVAITWMQQYRRDPYPKKIVWCQGDVMHRHFYWLTIPENEKATKGDIVRAELSGNTIEITACDYNRIRINLNDTMLNLDKKVKVRYKGKTVFKGKVARTEKHLRQSLGERGDIRYSFPSYIDVDL